MQKSKLLVAVLGALCAMPVLAADAPAAPAITGNVGFVSDYVFNGISQSYRSPAIQGGFDYAAANGLYVGTWASNISGNQYTNASMEWDMYGGYNGKVSEDLGYQVGLVSVMYPGGKAYNSVPESYKRWDTSEAILGATWKSLNIKLTYTLTDWYGINNSGSAPLMWAAGDSTAATGAPTADSATRSRAISSRPHKGSEAVVVDAVPVGKRVSQFQIQALPDWPDECYVSGRQDRRLNCWCL